jgi:hypothetical protein
MLYGSPNKEGENMTATKTPKRQMVPVSTRALIQRINRKLAHDGAKLFAVRGKRALIQYGEYFVIDWENGAGGAWPTHVDPEEYGRELGVLKTWEKWEASED